MQEHLHSPLQLNKATLVVPKLPPRPSLHKISFEAVTFEQATTSVKGTGRDSNAAPCNASLDPPPGPPPHLLPF
uniref:Uncharacterized protein n=1 Tax=Physcomitrium patens TaxID=3218 RepID=A0A2K1JD97_PHYPA|nr:hypothetical protein PHYPA_019782 [Physcomitrium patens]